MGEVLTLQGKPHMPLLPPPSPLETYNLPTTLSQMEEGLSHLCVIANEKPGLFTGIRIPVDDTPHDLPAYLRLVRGHLNFIERSICPPPPAPRKKSLRQRIVAFLEGGV